MSIIRTGMINVTVVLALCAFAVFYLYRKAATGLNISIRKLAALEAIPDAIGRSTEMGKKVYFSSGDAAYLSGPNAPMTLASLSVLRYVAETCAKYRAKLNVVIGGAGTSAELIPITEDIVREAYQTEGRYEDYTPEMVRFISPSQQTFVGMLVQEWAEESPGAVMLIGAWAGAAITLVERVAREGAIGIGGTPRSSQLMKMVAGMDYCLIAEELYAAGAVMSGDNQLKGSIFVQDIGKYVGAALLILGSIALSLGSKIIITLLTS